MKKIFLIIFMALTGGYVLAQDVIFQHPVTPDKVAVPEYGMVNCKFSQEKTIPNSTSGLKSGGNFQFNPAKGVTFETLYPVKTTTSYTSDENKRISDIIISVTKKDYSWLNKNFDLYYVKNGASWRLALKPKKSNKASGMLDSVIIAGSHYINKIDINTLKSGSTKINFTECRVP